MKKIVFPACLLLSINYFSFGQNSLKGKIVFLSEKQICIIDNDGKNEKILTSNSSEYAMPSWSPDAKKIIFYDNKAGSYDIYTIDADGKNLHPLTNYKNAHFPRWSPDGRKIAFHLQSKKEDKLEYAVYLMNIDGTERKKLLDYAEMVSWSPDGKKLVFSNAKDNNIYIINADGSGLSQLTNNGRRNSMPAWSPK